MKLKFESFFLGLILVLVFTAVFISTLLKPGKTDNAKKNHYLLADDSSPDCRGGCRA